MSLMTLIVDQYSRKIHLVFPNDSRIVTTFHFNITIYILKFISSMLYFTKLRNASFILCICGSVVAHLGPALRKLLKWLMSYV